ncbi:hypothetical protein K503DRAFT_771606 [Rhizopogon vinicolor AM-OR11-026]|uniref:Uncharacterized protein n=1 Tax=Rhizopogon vinicolor AM-OR11-026 TaxID=1314800 RepID=A0A1B7MXK3_9AGAM|nr:hypothetical protein K503DRAFT_771606 [Rhizopogon vinicolor AM-OR11-026]
MTNIFLRKVRCASGSEDKLPVVSTGATTTLHRAKRVALKILNEPWTHGLVTFRAWAIE